jgi:hypothetical protein
MPTLSVLKIGSFRANTPSSWRCCLIGRGDALKGLPLNKAIEVALVSTLAAPYG